MRVAFGEFVFDDETRELRRGPVGIRLSPRAFQLLSILLRARPTASSKRDLVAELWPDAAAGEKSLPSLVAELRKVLGESSRNTRFIKTVRGYGYAFGDGGDDPDAARGQTVSVKVRLMWGEGRAELASGIYVIGRGLEPDLEIDSETVSRRHARLTVGAGLVRLEDLGSTNGTWVRGARIHEPAELGDGDSFHVGSVRITLRFA